MWIQLLMERWHGGTGMKRVIRWVRVQLFGECPYCGGTHNKQEDGWQKCTCQDCGKTWGY